MFYMVPPPYATMFANLYGLYFFYGIAEGPPRSRTETRAAPSPRPTAPTGTRWPSRPRTQSSSRWATRTLMPISTCTRRKARTSGSSLGADTCYYFNQALERPDRRLLNAGPLITLRISTASRRAAPTPARCRIWECDTYNSEIEDQHMGGGGEVYIGGAQQHWIGGNFNNSTRLARG